MNIHKLIKNLAFITKIIISLPRNNSNLENFSGIVCDVIKTIRYFQNGKLHRDNGPAIEFINRGNKAWFQNGKLHRLDGPAVESWNGIRTWHIEGKQYLEENFWKKLKEINEI